ncbi:4Fe-4S dicluster domain-containing protein [Candidatus Hecatella orcuttiae]|uniref:4Fe-4S dicluster domain-containing protein n=1 Tax=Candidatus Hecatella orcuttiae TaxID=1935119 RepID=UPI002867F3DB|nr:4Fe-4S dicluster domain-containing protein [Candidatus Hecatella orcuttiae]
MRFHIEVLHPNRCIGCYNCVYACSRHLYNAVDVNRTAVFVRETGSLENPYHVIACRFCKDPECVKACPQEALSALPEGGISLTPAKCEGCKTYDCVHACKLGALAIDFKAKIPSPIVCDRCGDCAKFCPHNVFKYEEMKE